MSDQHEYPPAYAPGTNWANDAAWEMLDAVQPGVISPEVRAFLAGLIAERLSQERMIRREKQRVLSIFGAGCEDQIAKRIRGAPVVVIDTQRKSVRRSHG